MKHNEVYIQETPGLKYSSTLEEGDYIPNFVYKKDMFKISIQNSAGRPNIFVIIDFCNEKIYQKYKKIFKLSNRNIPYYIICKKSSCNRREIIVDKYIFKLFTQKKDNNIIIITEANLKIYKIINNINEYSYNIIENIPKIKPPIIIVKNVITKKFKDDIINFYNKSSRKNVENKISKNRTHVFTNINLTEMLDDKLTKSLFPEIKKVFNLDVTYRENYKICSYTDYDKGKFHLHRDSVYPYGHRRYAMSLILNDDYEGGEIIFPEYTDKMHTPESCSALIFPAPLFHQVLEMTKGTRYVIISFLFGDLEAEYKKKFLSLNDKNSNIDKYKINVQRDLRNILIDDICPQTFNTKCN